MEWEKNICWHADPQKHFPYIYIALVSSGLSKKLPQTSWFKTIPIYYLSLVVQKCKVSFIRLKPRCQLDGLLLEALEENMVIQLWELCSLGHDNLLSQPCSIFKSLSTSSLHLHSYKDLCDYIGCTWITQDNLLITKSLVTSAKSLLLCKEVNLLCKEQVLEIRTWGSLGSL